MIKVIIAGPRDYKNEEYVNSTLDVMIPLYGDVEIVEGGASGVDAIAKKYALKHHSSFKTTLKEFQADWNLYGRRAGPIRNNEMAMYSDVLIAFRYKKKPSSGTENMIKTALNMGLEIHIFNVEK